MRNHFSLSLRTAYMRERQSFHSVIANRYKRRSNPEKEQKQFKHVNKKIILCILITPFFTVKCRLPRFARNDGGVSFLQQEKHMRRLFVIRLFTFRRKLITRNAGIQTIPSLRGV
jgi:hypothetical protein